MGRGGKVNPKRNFKNRARSKDEGSDGSDEDYVVEVEDVSDDDLEDVGDSFDDYESEESFGNYVEEEEQEEFRKAFRSKNKEGSQAKRKIGGKTSRKRKRVSYEEEEEEEMEEEDEDYVNDDDDDDDEDEEFSPCVDDDDFLDVDEEFEPKKKINNMKVGKKSMQKRGTKRGRKKRKPRVSRKPLAKKGRKKARLRKKNRCEVEDEFEDDFIDDNEIVREKTSKNSGARRRRNVVSSDSDFVSSGSDHEYTISEEEREQVKEAVELYEGVKTSLRSSSSVKKIQEDGDLCQQGKSLARKGKEKVKEVKTEVGKQVCGICLSEEDKRRLKGTLDCCTHYFCFTCIMEWSKVESRCPLCKQRFKTITKNGRGAVGIELRNVVIQVPKRDQVYQPSEEEIRSFIDPYENVICTECHEGGEDGLMLLCDLCDSPAHTFCVGLGREVPEGNWYCEGCRPIALGSTSSQALDPMPDQRTTNNFVSRPSPNANNVEGLNPTLDPSPRLVYAQGFGNLLSPRFSAGDVQAASPVSGTGAPTLTQRRQLHRHIQNLISINRMNYMANRTDGISSANLHIDPLNPHNELFRQAAIQNSRRQEVGASQSTFVDERLEANGHPSASVQNGDLFSLPQSQIRMQAFQDPTFTTDRSVNLALWPELSGITPISGHDQFHQRNSRLGIASEVNLSPCRAREENQFYAIKEQLQSMVKSHLKSLSQASELGADTCKDILRSSTHTILAVCGLEHKRSEVHSVPSPSICTHVDRLIAGQKSILKDYCSSCFDSFVRDVVKMIMDTRSPQWLSLGL